MKITATILVFALCLLDHYATAGSECAREDNTRNMQHRLDKKHVENVDECASWCATNPQCKYWTFAKHGTWTLWNQNCFIMTSNEDRVENKGWISGSKSCPKVKCNTKKGKQCVFPFKYKNVLYTACTRRANGLFGSGLGADPWCATDVDLNGNYNGAWDNCDKCLAVVPAPPPGPPCGCGTVTAAKDGCQCGTSKCKTGQRCVQGQCKASTCQELAHIPMAQGKDKACRDRCMKTYCNGGCQSYHLRYGYADKNKNGCFLSSCVYKA